MDEQASNQMIDIGHRGGGRFESQRVALLGHGRQQRTRMNHSTFRLQLRADSGLVVKDDEEGGAEQSPDNAASVLLLFQVARRRSGMPADGEMGRNWQRYKREWRRERQGRRRLNDCSSCHCCSMG